MVEASWRQSATSLWERTVCTVHICKSPMQSAFTSMSSFELHNSLVTQWKTYQPQRAMRKQIQEEGSRFSLKHRSFEQMLCCFQTLPNDEAAVEQAVLFGLTGKQRMDFLFVRWKEETLCSDVCQAPCQAWARCVKKQYKTKSKCDFLSETLSCSCLGPKWFHAQQSRKYQHGQGQKTLVPH